MSSVEQELQIWKRRRIHVGLHVAASARIEAKQGSLASALFLHCIVSSGT